MTLIGFSYGLFLQQGWIPVVAPALALVLTSVTTLIDRQYQSQQHQQISISLLIMLTHPELIPKNRYMKNLCQTRFLQAIAFMTFLLVAMPSQRLTAQDLTIRRHQQTRPYVAITVLHLNLSCYLLSLTSP
jgi:hypothetical protein